MHRQDEPFKKQLFQPFPKDHWELKCKQGGEVVFGKEHGVPQAGGAGTLRSSTHRMYESLCSGAGNTAWISAGRIHTIY